MGPRTGLKRHGRVNSPGVQVLAQVGQARDELSRAGRQLRLALDRDAVDAQLLLAVDLGSGPAMDDSAALTQPGTERFKHWREERRRDFEGNFNLLT